LLHIFADRSYLKYNQLVQAQEIKNEVLTIISVKLALLNSLPNKFRKKLGNKNNIKKTGTETNRVNLIELRYMCLIFMKSPKLYALAILGAINPLIEAKTNVINKDNFIQAA
jgi:hypothetical protein